MLEYLVSINRFNFDMYMNDISGMKFQIHKFTFGAILYSAKT